MLPFDDLRVFGKNMTLRLFQEGGSEQTGWSASHTRAKVVNFHLKKGNTHTHKLPQRSWSQGDAALHRVLRPTPLGCFRDGSTEDPPELVPRSCSDWVWMVPSAPRWPCAKTVNYQRCHLWKQINGFSPLIQKDKTLFVLSKFKISS